MTQNANISLSVFFRFCKKLDICVKFFPFYAFFAFLRFFAFRYVNPNIFTASAIILFSFPPKNKRNIFPNHCLIQSSRQFGRINLIKNFRWSIVHLYPINCCLPLTTYCYDILFGNILAPYEWSRGLLGPYDRQSYISQVLWKLKLIS